MTRSSPDPNIFENTNTEPAGNKSSSTDTLHKSHDVVKAKKSSTVETKETPEQQRVARNYRWRLISGLLLPSILEAFDTTVIAAALPFIASEFSL